MIEAIKTIDTAEPERQRSDHDFSDRKQELRFMGPHDPAPASALAWQDGHSAGKVFRLWRRACFWKWRSMAVRSLASLLPDYAVQSGYAYPSNDTLRKEAFVSAAKIDGALTLMDHSGAIIRVYADIGRPRPQRRIYLARTIIAEFEATSSET